MKNTKPILIYSKEELIVAMGCTEPIAIAYAAAKARETLGLIPDRIEIEASDNILKVLRFQIQGA